MKTTAKHWTLPAIKDELSKVAQIGGLFVDGELCRHAWKPHAETFMRGDDMDYNPETVVPLKKTILRLERIAPFPCCTTLWRRRPDNPDTYEPLLYGSFSSPDGIMKPPNRNYKPPALTREMKSVFLKGKAAWKTKADANGKLGLRRRTNKVVTGDVRNPTVIQRYVPVKDSLGDIAAALEVFVIAMPE